MKKISSIFLILLFILFFVSSCTAPQYVYVEKDSSVEISNHGTWVINGIDTRVKAVAEDGRETTFRINEGILEWKYVGTEEWFELIVLESPEEENEEFTEGLILNEVTGRGYMVIGYDGDEKEITIPSTYRGIDVYKIGDEAFYESDVEKVFIGKNIKEIGAYAFSESANLTDVVFEEESILEELGDGVFYNCHALENINVPSTLKKLGRCVFFLLKSLVCEYDDEYGVKYLGNDENPYLILVEDIATSITKCVVNENCKFINDYALTYCSSLESVEIPEGVLSIGESAFYYCSSLTTIKIPSTVNYIGDAVFNCADNISEMIVDEDNAYYDSRENCNGIIHTKSNTLLYGCQSTVIPNTVERIEDKAYYGVESVESVYIPASVTSIGEYVFSVCTGLHTLVVDPENKVFTSRDKNGNECNVIIQKGSYSQTLLYGGAGIDGKLVIPEGVNYIEKEAFRGRWLLVEVTLPKSLSQIRDNAFDYCTNLKVVNNASKLQLEIKSSTHGFVAYYAETINKIN